MLQRLGWLGISWSMTEVIFGWLDRHCMIPLTYSGGTTRGGGGGGAYAQHGKQLLLCKHRHAQQQRVWGGGGGQSLGKIHSE